ncbi:MAG: RagB/SusD family nutrient uptake outer membrane protein [Schleiferiaceae bacterium]|nr:RagB/SusD family nutrient uptake outer membrane protein [Schleiferiaceae bacterium]
MKNTVKTTMRSMLAIAAAVLLTVGCSKDFLNTKPVGRDLEINYYQTQAQAFEALVSVYDVLQWNDQYGFTMYRFLMNVASDDTYAGGSDASDQPSWVATNNFSWTPNLGPQAGFWRKNYKGIYRANLFLEKIDGIDDASVAFKTRTKAEVHFLRAKFYFDLVRSFGNAPLITNTLDPSEYYTINQQGPEVIYPFIVAELEAAIPDLPTTVSSTELGRVTKGAAQALLARVYLQMDDEDNMADVASLCEEVINSAVYSLLPNYGDIFTKAGEWGSESVFEITYSENSTSDWGRFGSGHSEGNVGVQFCGMRDYNGPDYSPGWGFCPITEDLEAFMDGDPRYQYTIIDADNISGAEYSPGYQNTGFFMKKYAPLAGNFPPDGEPALNWGNNVREIRYADVLLMAAEGLVRSGGSEAQARSYLNQVRSRVGIQGLGSSGSQLLEDIYNERRMELATEGHRYFDLIRTGKAANVLTGWQAHNQYLPIPQNEIDASQGALTQNTGY